MILEHYATRYGTGEKAAKAIALNRDTVLWNEARGLARTIKAGVDGMGPVPAMMASRIDRLVARSTALGRRLLETDLQLPALAQKLEEDEELFRK